MDELRILKRIVASILIGIILIFCKDDNPTEPQYDSNLVGNWKVSCMSWEGPTESGSYDQSQLDLVGVIWNLNFMSDNTADQITNLSGPAITQSGRWTNSGNKLSLNLKFTNSDETGSMDYTYIVENDLLKLNWLLGDGTIFDAEFTK